MLGTIGIEDSVGLTSSGLTYYDDIADKDGEETGLEVELIDFESSLSYFGEEGLEREELLEDEESIRIEYYQTVEPKNLSG